MCADVSLASHRIRQQKCVVGQEPVLQVIDKRLGFWDRLAREVPNPLISLLNWNILNRVSSSIFWPGCSRMMPCV